MISRLEIEEKWLEKLRPKKNKKKHTYVHFDNKINNPKEFLPLVSNEYKVASHAFLPFVKFDKHKYKYKDVPESGKRVLVKKDKQSGERKVREIMYAGHLDTLIYVWYQSILEILYEKALTKYGLSSTVLAYRRIQNENSSGGKCNINFANEIFAEIKNKGEECVALTFDIEKFFPSLSHEHLKKKWCEILEETILPKDHYNIFRSLTQYSYVDLTSKDIKKLLKYRTKGQFAHTHAFFEGKYFSGEKFRKIKFQIRALERSSGKFIFCKNYLKKGIPQGSPMSGLLANIYMIDFDKNINQMVEKAGGIYKRYSDDIITVIPKNEASNIENAIRKRIKLENDYERNPYLVIKEEKTNRTIFLKERSRLISWKLDDKYNAVHRQPLQYLGFEFDGQDVFLRAGSIAKFYNQLRFGLKKIEACYEKGPLLKRNLFSKFTPLGKKNFFSYVKKSQEVISNNKFKKQLRKHWPLMARTIEKLEIKY
jgi:hypothetical protein